MAEPQRVMFPEQPESSPFLPLDYIEVNDRRIDANELMGGEIHHDVDMGTVTVTFVNVHTFITQYRHMQERT